MNVARYDAVARMYADNFDHRASPAGLALLTLTGNVRGATAVDLACGHGVMTRELARRGAKVVGVDISGELIALARGVEATEQLGVTYVHDDAAAFRWTEPVDLVTCNFGLSDIDDVDGALRTVHSLLRPRGSFVFSILHPCFPGSGTAAAAWPPDGTYYDEGWWRTRDPQSTLRRQVGANHRTLSGYLNALSRHDLPVEEALEPRPEEDWADRTGAGSYPVYFVARCRRT
ncbi:MAG: class I SAM-dependent methyltransferase [Actinobacteria bacterium]|nr:class I SAM-dependent methyltransferase [Actinomycetota bacterium]MCA1722585.1 class I SAM-dependent methyltransferase [Actinomycetota bacterium]